MALNRVTFFQTLYSQSIQNVMHFFIPDQVTASLPQLLADLRDHWIDVHRSWQVQQLTHVNLLGECLGGPDAGQIANLPTGITGNGSSAANSPLQLSLVLQLRTGFAGRKERGRIFIAGRHPNDMDQGNFNTADMTASITKCNTLISRWVSPIVYGASLVIHGPNDDASTYKFVASIQPRAAVGTQRRRGVGVGS